MQLEALHTSIHYYGVINRALVCPIRTGYWVGSGYNLNGPVYGCYTLDTDKNAITILPEIPHDLPLDRIDVGLDSTDSIVIYDRRDYRCLYRLDMDDKYWYRCDYLPDMIPDPLLPDSIPLVAVTDEMFRCGLYNRPIPLSCCLFGKNLIVVYGTMDYLAVVVDMGDKQITCRYSLPDHTYLMDGLNVWYNHFTKRILVHVPMSRNGRYDSQLIEFELKDNE